MCALPVPLPPPKKTIILRMACPLPSATDCLASALPTAYNVHVTWPLVRAPSQLKAWLASPHCRPDWLTHHQLVAVKAHGDEVPEVDAD